MDALYDAGINPLRFQPGKGIAIWGQKTLLSRPSALQRLNVRLMLIVVEPAVAIALDSFTFELIDTALQNLAVTLITSYMDTVKANKGVYDYQVVSNSSNNTPSDLDNNTMHVDLYVKPTSAAEFIPLRVIITSNSISFAQAQSVVGG
jgi:phage tail sheath protein FI